MRRCARSIDLERQLDEFEALYAEVIADYRSAPSATDELVAALGPVLHRWLPRAPGTDWPWQFERADLLARVAELDATLARERSEAMSLPEQPGRRHASFVLGARCARPSCRTKARPGPLRSRATRCSHRSRRLCDDTRHPRRSPLRLLEDGKPLGPAHALHQSISEEGGGRYSHWSDNTLIFSTSDNSDPNANGREYSVAWFVPEVTATARVPADRRHDASSHRTEYRGSF